MRGPGARPRAPRRSSASRAARDAAEPLDGRAMVCDALLGRGQSPKRPSRSVNACRRGHGGAPSVPSCKLTCRRGLVSCRAAPMQRSDYIWLDGAFVPWDEARVHVLTHTLHYGLGVFEGVRCYEGAGRPLRRSFACASTPSACSRRRTSSASRSRSRREQIDAACIETVAPQPVEVVLHPPAGLPRRRRDGAGGRQPNPGRAWSSLALGLLPRRRRACATAFGSRPRRFSVFPSTR